MTNTIFSQRLKQLRKRDNKNQDEMAKMLNVTRSAYGSYERGTAKPQFDTLVFLADYFDVTVDYLVGKDEPVIIETKNDSYNNLTISKVRGVMEKYVSNLELSYLNNDEVKTLEGIKNEFILKCSMIELEITKRKMIEYMNKASEVLGVDAPKQELNDLSDDRFIAIDDDKVSIDNYDEYLDSRKKMLATYDLILRSFTKQDDEQK